jgi:hypothetical protein
MSPARAIQAEEKIISAATVPTSTADLRFAEADRATS